MLESGRLFRFGRYGRLLLVAGLGRFLILRVLLGIGCVGLRQGRCRAGLGRVRFAGALAAAFCGLGFSG